MKGFMLCLAVAVPAAAAMLDGASAADPARFTVYCASGHVAIDSRPADDLRRQWGACPLSESFATQPEAIAHARERFGGIGAPCACGKSG